jgi:nitrate/nitrite transport system ATP-binding protein
VHGTNDVDEALLLADRIIPLNSRPRATLGPEFRVDLARPRDRKDMNHDPQTGQSRVHHAIPCSTSKQKNRGGRGRDQIPDVVPITSADFLPKAVRAANKPKPLSNPDKYVEFYNVHKVYPTPKGPLAVVEDSISTSTRRVCVADRVIRAAANRRCCRCARASRMCPTAASRSTGAK